MTIPKASQQAALISAASIILASMTLLSVRAVHPAWLSDQLDALLLSLACGVGVGSSASASSSRVAGSPHPFPPMLPRGSSPAVRTKPWPLH